MKISEILFELRKSRRFTQEEMAEKLFVTRQAVSRWETGETMPNIETLKHISQTFDISISHLLGLSEDKLCLFKQDEFTFSYRAAGILIQNGKVLLQKPNNTDEYAFPGGLVIFGETTKEALIRRWREEMGLDIEVGELKWIEENIFVLDGKPSQQICLDYIVKTDGLFPNGTTARTYSKEDKNAVCFYWIPLDKVETLKVYPERAAELLLGLDEPLEHLIYLENAEKTQ